jgi:hypothetical protein
VGVIIRPVEKRIHAIRAGNNPVNTAHNSSLL